MAYLYRLLSIGTALTLAGLTVPAQAVVVVEAQQYSPPEIFGGYTIGGTNRAGTVGRFRVRTSDGREFFSYCIDAVTPFYTFSPYAFGSIGDVVADPIKQNQLAALLINANPLVDAAGSMGEQSAIAAAVGLAIWEILYESGSNSYDISAGNFSVFGDFAALVTRSNGYLLNVTSGTWTGSESRLRTLISEKGADGEFLSQNQVFLSAVPEPETWAAMLLGFGIVGAAMRRRRREANVRVRHANIGHAA